MVISALPACRITITVAAQPFDMAEELEKLRCGGNVGSIGAIVSFLGLCRDEGARLAALEIEHFPGMAQAEIGRIAALAVERFPLCALHIIHRYGRISVGEEIVLVIAASAHRVAAFEAAEFVMDYLKTDAPFWKKQYWRDAGELELHRSDWVAVNQEDLERRSHKINEVQERAGNASTHQPGMT